MTGDTWLGLGRRGSSPRQHHAAEPARYSKTLEMYRKSIEVNEQGSKVKQEVFHGLKLKCGVGTNQSTSGLTAAFEGQAGRPLVQKTRTGSVKVRPTSLSVCSVDHEVEPIVGPDEDLAPQFAISKSSLLRVWSTFGFPPQTAAKSYQRWVLRGNSSHRRCRIHWITSRREASPGRSSRCRARQLRRLLSKIGQAEEP